jgi:hypothetical protein
MTCLAGCEGGANGGSGGGGRDSPTTVTYTFTGSTPTAVATQIGTGAYTQASLQSNTLTLSIPSGTTDYSVAYVCPENNGAAVNISNINGEQVILASIEDGTSFSLICGDPSVADVGTATVQVNAAAIPGVTFVSVGEVGPNLQPWSGSTLSLSLELVSGIHDVAVIAVGANSNVLAVRILRNQTIPGALNGGNPVVLGASDMTVPQTITYSNVPSGFAAPSTGADYLTAGGVRVDLNFNATSQYFAVPSGEVQSGDSYAFAAATNSTTTPSETMYVGKPQVSGGGPQAFTFPTPWTYAGPTAAALPTFNFDYAGFSGTTDVTREGIIEWSSGTSVSSINMLASANYQNGATAISIPDLSGITGFIAPAPTGTTIHWQAGIGQGVSVGSVDSSSTVTSVGNSGAYTEP